MLKFLKCQCFQEEEDEMNQTNEIAPLAQVAPPAQVATPAQVVPPAQVVTPVQEALLAQVAPSEEITTLTEAVDRMARITEPLDVVTTPSETLETLRRYDEGIPGRAEKFLVSFSDIGHMGSDIRESPLFGDWGYAEPVNRASGESK
ncbi:hypothetical protein BC937DRAFT_91213 [Endogone sp. FLAS-F59071]|nr:hypothetical protein BC937DRAFT_91213 [Endogone sp. FLAS-F59071]|eukprot:RUS16429.1 hypothetical protein BC937DRAFT_91213 [Endogone sp. FLAS-F59071]